MCMEITPEDASLYVEWEDKDVEAFLLLLCCGHQTGKQGCKCAFRAGWKAAFRWMVWWVLDDALLPFDLQCCRGCCAPAGGDGSLGTSPVWPHVPAVVINICNNISHVLLIANQSLSFQFWDKYLASRHYYSFSKYATVTWAKHLNGFKLIKISFVALVWYLIQNFTSFRRWNVCTNHAECSCGVC